MGQIAGSGMRFPLNGIAYGHCYVSWLHHGVDSSTSLGIPDGRRLFGVAISPVFDHPIRNRRMLSKKPSSSGGQNYEFTKTRQGFDIDFVILTRRSPDQLFPLPPHPFDPPLALVSRSLRSSLICRCKSTASSP